MYNVDKLSINKVKKNTKDNLTIIKHGRIEAIYHVYVIFVNCQLLNGSVIFQQFNRIVDFYDFELSIVKLIRF
jgi:hypothetical protein